jgi:glycosyltransferase 2 family protein
MSDVAAGVELVVVEPPEPAHVRSPSDVLRLGIAAVLLAVLLVIEVLFGDAWISFVSDLTRGGAAVASWVVVLVLGTARGLAALFLVGGFVATVVRGRWRFLMVVAAAGALGALCEVLIAHVDPAAGRRVLDTAGAVASFPGTVGLAAATAVVTASAPWLRRRWRRIGWLLVVVITLSRLLIVPLSFASVRSVLVGWFTGCAVLVVFGGPSRRPRGAMVAAGLAAAGLPLARLEHAGVDARGSTPYFGIAADGRRLFIKALGTDERSADLLFRLYRRIVPHDLRDERPFSSLRRAVEHEALVALVATSAGIRTPAVVAFAAAEPNAFVLAYEAIEGTSLDRVEAEELTDDLLRSAWSAVDELHYHGIAHRDLRLANIFLASDGKLWIVDFGFSELAAGAVLINTDCAELVASTATRVGAPRAVAAAMSVAGAVPLAGALTRLHPWALSGATRAACKQDPTLLPAVRSEIARASRVSATAR